MSRHLRVVFAVILGLIALVGQTKAQNVVVPWSTFNAGGGRAAGSGLLHAGTHGQAVVGRSVAGDIVLAGGFLATRILLGPITGAPEQPLATLPVEFGLSQNYPNPFNPSTTIQYQLAVQGRVTLRVYDVLGREVMTLVDEIQTAGFKSAAVNADGLASGVYFYTLATSEFVQTKRLMVLK